MRQDSFNSCPCTGWVVIISTQSAEEPRKAGKIRVALAFAYELWDVPNPFARIRPPRGAGVAPAVAYLGAPELARLLEALRVPTAGQHVTYGDSVVFYLAATLFYTAARYTHVHSECTRATLESLDQSLPATTGGALTGLFRFVVPGDVASSSDALG